MQLKHIAGKISNQITVLLVRKIIIFKIIIIINT